MFFRLVLFFILFIFVPSCFCAEDEWMIPEIRYLENVSELPESTALYPDIQWTQNGNIYAWIDILGFRGMLRERNIDYISGNPESLAIVQYDAYGSVYGIIDSIDKTVSYFYDGTNLAAILSVTLYWHINLICCDDDGCFVCGIERHTDYASFQDIELVPVQYNRTLQPIPNITEFEYPIEQKISVQVVEQNASKVKIEYNGSSATHIIRKYVLEQTPKGVNFGNTTFLNNWSISGSGIGRAMNLTIIDINMTEIDYSKLQITVSDFYNTTVIQKDVFNVSRITYNMNEILWNSVLIGVFGILFILGWGIYMVIRTF